MTRSRHFAAALSVALAVGLMPTAARAQGYCGAASYNCCPVEACQQTCCYTTYRTQRETCYRNVNYLVQEPEQYSVCRTVYETAYDDVQETCYRNVVETAYREEPYQVCKQVVECAEREERYTVQRPVWETTY